MGTVNPIMSIKLNSCW